MTRKTCAAALLALALVASSASAEEMKKGQLIGSLGGGVAVPTGDYGDVAKSGFGGSANFDYAVSPAVTLGGTFQYNRNSISSDLKAALDIIAYPSTVNVHYTILHYGANMKYFFTPERKTRPYFTAGGGIYSYKLTVETTGLSISSDSQSDGGINGGFGVMFDTGTRTHIGLQGQYNDIFTSGSSTQYFNVAVVFGLDLNTP